MPKNTFEYRAHVFSCINICRVLRKLFEHEIMKKSLWQQTSEDAILFFALFDMIPQEM